MLAERVCPPVAEPRLHERVVADGADNQQQREGPGEQRTRPPLLQEQSRTVGHHRDDGEQEKGSRGDYMRQYQDIATEQQEMVQPFFPEQATAPREQQREEQYLEEQRIVGE